MVSHLLVKWHICELWFWDLVGSVVLSIFSTSTRNIIAMLSLDSIGVLFGC